MNKGEYKLDGNNYLVFSIDDETETGKGWYIQRYPDGKTSQLFEVGTAAIDALKFNRLKFS